MRGTQFQILLFKNLKSFSLRCQTVHFVNFKWIRQQALNIIVAESATLLFFFYLLAVLDSMDK